MKKWMLSFLLLPGLALAETGTVIKSSDLRAKPFADAVVTGSLPAKAVVTINKRQGAWMQVTTAQGTSGWIKLLNVRTGSGTSKGGGETVGKLASLFKTGSSGTTVSTGVKGLSEEQLKTAQPDEKEAARLKGFSSSAADARQAAKQAKLKAQDIAYIRDTQGGQ